MSLPVMTKNLKPGDQVRLFNGIVRTVREVVVSRYLNRHNEPILYVRYVEPASPEWGDANSSHASGVWEVQNRC